MGKRHVTARARSAVAVKRAAPDAQFVALQIETSQALPLATQAVMIRVHVRLPNGVEFDLSETSLDALSPLIGVLSAISCSSSTTR